MNDLYAELLKILASLVWFPCETFNREQIAEWSRLRTIPMEYVSDFHIKSAEKLRSDLQSQLAGTL